MAKSLFERLDGTYHEENGYLNVQVFLLPFEAEIHTNEYLDGKYWAEQGWLENNRP